MKVRLKEAQEHVRLVLGVELPDEQYVFPEYAVVHGSGANTIVKYTIDFMGESNVDTVTFRISPENSENGFVM